MYIILGAVQHNLTRQWAQEIQYVRRQEQLVIMLSWTWFPWVITKRHKNDKLTLKNGTNRKNLPKLYVVLLHIFREKKKVLIKFCDRENKKKNKTRFIEINGRWCFIFRVYHFSWLVCLRCEKQKKKTALTVINIYRKGS